MNLNSFQTKLNRIIFPLVLFLFCMYPINRGVDISDTMYSLSSNVLFTKADGNWCLFMAYYLANLVGFLFTLLPFGHTMIGINFYTSLVVYGSALLVYIYFGRRKEIPCSKLFLLEMIALSFRWCPTTVLYNFLSYFLWILAIMLLRRIWTTENEAGKIDTKSLFIAGLLLGLAVTAKFSNITAAIFILLVFYYAFLTKEKAIILWKKVGICVAGFFVGFGTVVVLMELVYGIGTYGKMIQYLFGMTETATDYKADGMLSAILQYYGQVFPFVIGIIVAVLAGCLMLLVTDKIDSKLSNRKATLLARAGCYVCVLILIRFYYGRGLFGTNYQDTFAIVFIGTLLLWGGILVSLWTLFKKNATVVDKCDALLLILLIFITPLGSNNGVYPLLDNLFLILPLGYKLFYTRLKQTTKKIMGFTVSVMYLFFLLLSLYQGFRFYTMFTFKGQDAEQICDTKLTNNDILFGMKTNKERAIVLEEAIQEADGAMKSLSERNLITYGNTPGFFFLLEDANPVLTTTWPDLDSYSVELFQKELLAFQEDYLYEGKERPLLILTTEVSEEMDSETPSKKEESLKEFMKVLEYDMMFANEKYEIWY